MVRLMAKTTIYYGGIKHDVGDIFDVDPKHTKVIMGMGAVRVPMRVPLTPPADPIATALNAVADALTNVADAIRDHGIEER